MMMKKILAAFLALALLFISSSCDGQNTDKQTAQPVTQGSQTPIVKKDGPMTIYIYRYINEYTEKAIEKFNSAGYGKIKAEIFEFNLNNRLHTKIETELAAGIGPDLFVVSYYDIPHLIKFVKNGSFANLDEFIENDKEFNPDEYEQQIMNYGIFNGSRYILPLSYYVHGVLFTTQQIVEKYQLPFESRFITCNDLANMASTFREKYEDEGKFLLHAYAYQDSIFGFSNLNVNLGINKTKESLEKYYDIASSTYYRPGQGISNNSEYYSILPEEKVMLNNNGIYNFASIREAYNECEPGFIPEVFAIAYGSENKLIASPIMLAAINANCADKDAAYKFIKIMLSEEIQKEIDSGIPVNIAARDYKKSAFIDNPNEKYNYTEIDNEQAEILIDQISEVLEWDLAVKYTDDTIDEVLASEAIDYYYGKKTPEEAIQSMQARIKDYLEGDISEYVKPSETPSPGVPAVSIWRLDMFDDAGNAVKAFNEKRKDVRIEETVYSSDSREEFVNKLTTSIMPGEGPDIIHYDRYLFNSLRKTGSAGVFCDLDELIAKDSTFKSLDLNYRVLDAGVFDGKRYAIPLRYEFPLLMSTASVLEQCGVEIDESNWTIPEFRKMVLDYAGRTGNDYFIDSLFMFKYLVGGCGVDFIDYEAKTANFVSKEFIDLMKYYKEIYPHITPVEIDMTYDLFERMIQNHTIAMHFDITNLPERLWATNSECHGILGEEPIIYPIPTMGRSEDIPVSFTHAVSINQTCAKKQAALDFIEVLLSEDIQGSVDRKGNYNITLGFPVNNKALRNEIEKYMDPSIAERVFSNGIASVPFSKELASRIIELANRACAGPEIDLEVYKIIGEGMKSYLEGKQTAEQAAREINNKVSLFLNE